MEKNWTEFYGFTSKKTGEDMSVKVYVMKVSSVYYFGFEETKLGRPIYGSIEQVCQDMAIKYKTRPENYFFFYWHPTYKNRGVEQIELKWEGPIPSSPLTINKFCEYSKNPFLS